MATWVATAVVAKVEGQERQNNAPADEEVRRVKDFDQNIFVERYRNAIAQLSS